MTTEPFTKVLAIDPGTLRAGYGVLTGHWHTPEALDYGTIKMPAKLPIEERLHFLHIEIGKLIAQHQPDAVAVEEPFVGKGPRSSIAVGQAQAIVFISAASNRIPVHKYAPATVKAAMGSGAASKELVRQMVQTILKIDGITSNDTADALAVGICHLGKAHLREAELSSL